MQELHDQIQVLLQDRDPKAHLDVQSINTAQVSDASLPAASEQTIAPVPVSPEDGDGEEAGPVDSRAPSQEVHQPGTEAPATSENTAAGPVAEGDVANGYAAEMDTTAKPDLNNSVVDDYIQVQNPSVLKHSVCRHMHRLS